MKRQSHPRIQAQITGKAKVIGAIEAHERNVLAITRAVVTLEAKARVLTRQLAETRTALKAKRRELRAVLQRDSSITPETADDRLPIAGKADAIDATLARIERTR